MARKKTNPEAEVDTLQIAETPVTQDTAVIEAGLPPGEDPDSPVTADPAEAQAESLTEVAPAGDSAECASVQGFFPETLDLPDVSDSEEFSVSEGLQGVSQEAEQAERLGVEPSEKAKTVPRVLSKEEIEWGFHEEINEADPVSEPMPPSASPKSDRQKFYELNFNELDRYLTEEERREWNSIYASYRGQSALSGRIIGVDPRSVYIWNRRTGEKEKRTMLCAIVLLYRVPIAIPETELWIKGEEPPDYVTEHISGANIDFIITKVDREGGYAVGSRRLASRSQRYFFAHREDLHRIGTRIKCQMMAVGPRRCLVHCYGHDFDFTQRDMSYAAIPDMRLKYHRGMELDCIVKSFDPQKDALEISVKETETNPFFGAELRHPTGCRRLAVISGKYGGGVFCNLPDGTVCMCNYSYQHEDSDFMVGENVILVVQRYDNEKLQMYGKIMSKW